MKLAIKSIKSAGDLTRERIVLAAIESCDIGGFAVLAARRGSTTKAVQGGMVPYCFWFPDKEVKKDDLIVLYTKKGKSSVKTNPSGTTSHFLYWELDQPVWREDKIAVLCEIGKQWSPFPVVEEDVVEETPPPD